MGTLIKYKKKSTYLMFGLGITYLIVGIISYSQNSFLKVLTCFGVFYIGLAIYNLKYQYAKITDEYIKKTGLFTKKIEIKEITSVKRFAGDFIFKTAYSEISLDGSHIDADSISKLEKFYETVNSRLSGADQNNNNL